MAAPTPASSKRYSLDQSVSMVSTSRRLHDAGELYKEVEVFETQTYHWLRGWIPACGELIDAWTDTRHGPWPPPGKPTLEELEASLGLPLQGWEFLGDWEVDCMHDADGHTHGSWMVFPDVSSMLSGQVGGLETETLTRHAVRRRRWRRMMRWTARNVELEVMVCSARGLPDKPSSLPTAVLTLGNQQGSTITGATGPNPTWNESFAFELKQEHVKSASSLRVKLCTTRGVSARKESVFGQVRIPIKTLLRWTSSTKGIDDWFEMTQDDSQSRPESHTHMVHGLPAVRLRLAMRPLGTGPRNVVNRSIGSGMSASHGSQLNLQQLGSSGSSSGSSGPGSGSSGAHQKLEVIASGQLEVDGFMWTTRQYVLTPAALQLYVVGEDAPCDVILVENVKELAVGVGEQAVDVLLHCWNASRYSLPHAPKTREMLTWRLRLESSGSRAEFVTSFADAMRRLQVANAWRDSLLPLPTPDVSLVHVAVRAVKGVDVEYTAARNLSEGGQFNLAHVFGASMLHLGLATPIGPCTVNLPVADLIRHALDRTALATQAHMSCDNAGRKVRCNLKLAFKVQTETTQLALTIGFVMSLLLAHCTRVLWFRAPVFAVDVYAVLGVLQLATLVFATSWAFFAISTAGSELVRCIIGQAMCVEVKRMELVAEPEDGPQTFQELLDGEVPGRFVEGSPDDLDDARKRWIASCKYKRDKQIYNLLEERQPRFHLLKSVYPMCYHKRCKIGRPLVIEKLSSLKESMRVMKENGISVEDVLRQVAFVNEFVWTHLDRSKLPGGKMVRILDVAGVNVMDMTSEILNFIREVGNMLGHNYPERQALIYIVNVPPMFDMLWRMVQPFIRPVTRKKVRMLAAAQVQTELLKVIDADCLPQEYGGDCCCKGPGGCFQESEEERKLRSFVASLEEKAERDELKKVPEHEYDRFIVLRDNALWMAS